MARIETYNGRGGTTLLEWMKDTLTDMHTFVDVIADEEHSPSQWYKLFYTNDSYLYLDASGQYFEIRAKNDTLGANHQLINAGTSGQGHPSEIVQSDKGDIMLRLAYNMNDIPGEGKFIFALCKCKHGITGAESWLVMKPRAQDINRLEYLVTDDYVDAKTISPSPTASTSSEYLAGGFNSAVNQTVLIPLCAPSSSYICENSFFVHLAKNAHYGDTLLNGKHYYFFNLFAMLDGQS